MDDAQPGTTPSEDEFVDDIVAPTVEYELPVPQKKEFLPWHEPRKHYVRQYQWCNEIKKLLEKSDPSENTLKYFGLPGVDLLDLRHFQAEICAPRNLKLRFLGFNTAANPSHKDQTELNVSIDEVRRLGGVDHLSKVLGDNFVRIANENSIAWKETRSLGPFDVVNLDLCNGFGAMAPDRFEDTHYRAVSKLLSLQARMKTPWLLLLTTRAGHGHVDDAVLKALLGKYVANLECAAFKKASGEVLGIEDQAAVETAASTSAGVLPLFLCGLTKWLVAMALEQNPPTRVDLRSVIGYRVVAAADHEDLISLALRFTPTFEATSDPLCLAGQPAPRPDECALSVKALKQIGERKDADKVLRADRPLLSRMVDEMAQLLEVARYDTPAYRALHPTT